MTLRGLAVAFLIAAAAVIWLPLVLVGVILAGAVGVWVFLPNFRAHSFNLMVALLICSLRMIPMPWGIHSKLGQEDQSVHLEIVIVGDPTVSTFPGRSSRVRIPASLRALRKEAEDKWSFARGRILIERDLSPEMDLFVVGTRWESTGILEARSGPYVGLHRSTHRFTPDMDRFSRVQGSLPDQGLHLLFNVRERLLNRIEQSSPEESPQEAVLQALLLGSRTEMESESLNRFARTGLIHVFAISGLHMGMLAVIFWAVLRRCGACYRFRIWFVLPVLLLFVLFSGGRASSLRALIMIFCLWASSTWYRRVNVGQAFALAVCILLVLSPGQITDIGFQYSFLLTGGLLGIAPLLSHWFSGALAPDPWAPARKGAVWRERHLWSKLRGALVISFACFLISAPLTAYHFNLFSPVGLVGNLLAVPLVFLILLTGIPALLLSLLPFGAGEVFLQLPALFASVLLQWTSFLESVPMGWQWVRAPAIWMILAGYSCLIGMWWKPAWRRPFLFGAVSLMLFYSTHRILEMSQTQCWVLPADRGQSFLLRKGFRPAILIDAGSTWSGRKISEELRKRGVDRIEALFLTHLDAQHLGGWKVVKESHTPRRILVAAPDLKNFSQMEEVTNPEGIAAGNVLHLAGWTVEILHPDADTTVRRRDDRSLVFRCSSGFTSVLFMGGGGKKVEDTLLAQPFPLASRWLCAGNPRRESFCSADFLDAVSPEVVVVTGEEFEGISLQRRSAEQRAFLYGARVLRGKQEESVILR